MQDRNRQGRQGRQVMLDHQHRVLYSTPDTTMYRTGISSGIGFPEICLDQSHCSVLVPAVGAAMRKIRKSDPNRDAVPMAFVRIKLICEAMLLAISGADSADAQHGVGEARNPGRL